MGNRLSVDPSWPKIHSFITKLVKGLYYFEYDEVLPKSAIVQTSEHFWFFSDDLTPFLKISRNGKRCWEGVFEYRTNRVAENPLVSMWMFLFYGQNVLLARTIEKKTFKNDESGRD